MNDNLRVIQGGLKTKDKWRRYFLSAYITDTRLMGAMGMYIHWRAAEGGDTADYHQFFYFETEETGFETYRGLWSEDPLEVLTVERENIGGLGGTKVNLTLSEARQILRHYCEFNLEHDLPLPEGKEEYLKLAADLPNLTPDEEFWLLMKQCAPIRNEYALINYFLMRSFGKDLEAVRLLTHDASPVDVYPGIGIATLCKNTIKEKRGLFLCDSLIEHDGQYEVVVHEIRVIDEKIQRCRRTSGMKISPQEAALILSRPEYINVYQVVDALPVDFDEEDSRLFTLDFDTVSDGYEDGRLFFSFYSNNSHVELPTYRLSGDVYGVYYLTDYGQLLVMAYEQDAIRKLEQNIARGDMAGHLILTDKYEFPEPILYEFIQSDYVDFNDYVRPDPEE